jgi:GDP-4-dehydro-6-deoxy-D-mannose reductase
MARDRRRGDGALLLTGAQGFLGRHVAAEWLRRHPHGTVVGLGRSEYSGTHFTYTHTIGGRRVPANLPASLTISRQDERSAYRRADVRDMRSLRTAIDAQRPDVIVHAAAALRGDRLDRLLDSNVLATAAVARLAGESRSRLVVVSSGSVQALVGTDVVDDPDPYAATKLAGERIAALESASSGTPTFAARVFNLVGAGLQDRHLPSRVAFELAVLERSGGGRLSLGDLSAERDLIDVRDAARGVVALATADETTLHGLPDHDGIRVVDVGTGRVHAMRDVVRMQIEEAGLTGRVDVDETRRRSPGASRLRADPSGLDFLDAQPQIALEQSLREMADYARSHV